MLNFSSHKVDKILNGLKEHTWKVDINSKELELYKKAFELVCAQYTEGYASPYKDNLEKTMKWFIKQAKEELDL